MSRSLVSLLVLTLASCTAQGLEGDNNSFGQHRAALTVSASAIGTEAPLPVKYNTGDYLSVASSDSEQLVVFADGGRVRGVRYDRSGKVLDLDPWISLGRGEEDEGPQYYPDVAYGDGVYMVVYGDDGETAPGLYVQAISPEGQIVSPPALVDANGGYGTLVFNGSDFTVAYYDGDIGLARVALDGSVIESTKVQVTTGSVTNRPRLAMADEVGLVVFDQEKDGAERKVYAARFTPEGAVLDPGGVLISNATTSSVELSVASGTSEFLAIWGGPAGAIYGSLLDFDGQLLRQEFQISKSGASVGGSTVAFDGTHYAVVWVDGTTSPGSIYGTRLDNAGDRVDEADVLISTENEAGQSFSIDLAWSVDRYSLAYRNLGIDGQFLGADLNPTQAIPFALSVLPNAQYINDVVFDGEQYVRGFTHEIDDYSNDELRASSVNASGEVTESQAEVIGLSGPDEFITGFGLASSGQSTLYTYSIIGDQTEGVLRVKPKGGVLSAPLVQPWLTNSSLRLRSNGQGYLGLFEAGANANGNATEIWAQVFDAQGSLSGESFLLKSIESPRFDLCRSGDGYLLVYSGYDIQGEPITGSVITLSATGEELKDHGPVVPGMQSTTVASNGQQSLFAWESNDAATVYGRLLDHKSGWAEPFVISDAEPEGGVAVEWEGEQFVVAWPQARSALWARTIASDGSMSSPEELIQGDFVSPRLTAGKDGQILLSYVHYREWSRTRRVESLVLGDLELPTDPTGSTTSQEDTASTTEDSGVTTSNEGTGETTDASTSSETSGTSDPDGPDAVESSASDSRADRGCSVSQVGRDPSFFWLWSLLLAGGLARGVRRRT